MKTLNRGIYAVIGVIVMLAVGMIYAWSTMSKTISAAHPDWTVAQLSLTFTLVMAFFCIGSLAAGALAKKLNTKVFLIVSAILLLAGFFVASLTQNSLITLYLGFGVLGGFGSGFTYNTVMGTISAWFPDKQGLLSGVMLMGFGISSFIIGKLFAAISPADGTDGWTATFKMFGIFLFVILLVCGLIIKKPGADFKPPAAAGKKALREPALDINTGKMVRKPVFWLYYIWAILISGIGLVLLSQASGIAVQVGPAVAGGTIATVVGLISIFNGIGRVIFGAIYDKKGYKLVMIMTMTIFILASLILIGALMSGQFVLVVAGFVIGGFAYGGVTPTNSAIISDFFGRTHFPMNFSLINTNLLIASFASTIAGKLFDMSQSYMSTIFMMIGLAVAGFIVFIGIRRPKAE